MTTAEATHVHHWLMASPCGPITPAKCKTCGEERNFPASLEGQYDPALMESLSRSSEAGVKARKGKTFNAGPISSPEKNMYVFDKQTQTRVAPDGKARNLELSSAQLALVAWVKAHDGCRTADVAKAVEITGEAARARLGILISRGAIVRRPNPDMPGSFTYHATPLAACTDANGVMG